MPILTPKKIMSAAALLTLAASGYHLPGGRCIPVAGATEKDWHPDSFWYSPWGKSGVHKGIDIFASEGTPVVAATSGLVLYTGQIQMGGNVVLTLGEGWRLFYYAHLRDIHTQPGQWLTSGETLGAVGSTGNALGKPPHLHFSIRSLLPMLSQFDIRAPQPFQRMYYVDPGEFLKG